MPITQSRFVTILDAAAQIISFRKQLTDTLNNNLEQDFVNLNSMIDHAKTENEKDALKQIFNKLSALKDISIPSQETLEFMAIVLAEKKHFEKNARNNEKHAFYARENRRSKGILPRNKTPEFIRPRTIEPTFIPESNVAPLPKDFMNTPEYKRFQEEMRRMREREEKENISPPQNIAPPQAGAEMLNPNPPAEPNLPAEQEKQQENQQTITTISVDENGTKRFLPSNTDLYPPAKNLSQTKNVL